MKKLNSGIVIDTQQYYNLLDWKDKNFTKFVEFIETNHLSYSINNYTKEQYDKLVIYSLIDK